MAAHAIPYFKNDAGLARIRIHAREFMCVGASPPLDHPHIFIDMGSDAEAICPYCSTVFVYDASLKAAAEPADCVFEPGSIAA
ncbi:MAG: zinc-finger domain-containing protein [Hyphomicrobiales bacterium]